MELKVKYRIHETDDYQAWLYEQTLKTQLQIDKRLRLIKEHGHFGDHKSVSDFIWELRWKNGRRIYFAYIRQTAVVLLLGGNKNGQSKDIAQAEKIFKKNS